LVNHFYYIVALGNRPIDQINPSTPSQERLWYNPGNIMVQVEHEVYRMAKRIGILGGISAESTAEYYRRLIAKYVDQWDDYYTPEIVIFSLNFQRFTDLEESDDRENYVAEIMTGIRSLEEAGADLIIMAANSPHAVFEQIQALALVPMISIVQVTAREAKRLNLKRLLLLGIKFTMNATFYQRACTELGMEVEVPSETEQEEINRIIFDQLARGIIKERSKQRLLEIIDGYPVDGVILGCTELPLILQQKDSPVPLLDTLELHVGETLRQVLS
jgi:aspartate racemase